MLKRGREKTEITNLITRTVLILCLVAAIILCLGTTTPLKAQQQVQSPPASPSQPSAPAPVPPQPVTPTPVQPSEIPAPKPTPPLQLQPSPAPSAPTPPPVPGQVRPPTRRPLAPQPTTSPATPPPTPTTQPPSIPTQAQPTPPTAAPAPVATSPATPAAPPSQQVSPAPPRMGSGVVFNFDNADIYEVIRVMAEILRINYIIDPRVKGIVNIHTSGQLSAENTFPIFQSILRLNGATAVKKDGVYEIVPLADAKKLPQPPSTTREPGKAPSEERYIIQIVSLKYIPATEVSKMVKPFLSDGADIVEHPPSNTLIIGDLASNVKKSVDIISLFDLDIFADLRVRIYPILNADVTEVAKEMDKIFTSLEVSTKSGRGVGITFTPVTRINSLLVVSSIPNIFEKVEGWLKELDKIPVEGTKYSVFVYYCQNAKAKDLADVLKEVFGKVEKKKEKEKVGEQLAYPKGVKPPPTPAPTTAAKEEAAGAVPEGEINIVVDETNNALVIRAFARDYKNILDTVKRLDIYPKQVLIEVFLAEITLDESNKFGVEWAKFMTQNPANPNQTQAFVLGAQPPVDPFSADLPQTGFRYAIVELGGRLSAAINLAAAEDRLKVISSPHIIASNNKEAKIQVGSSQPILTSTYAYGSSASSGNVITGTTTQPSTGLLEGTIEYKDIGIILSVTPRISDGGLVSLEINIEKSTVNTSAVPLGNLQNIPVFGKKTAKTFVAVLEGQTIVIGGLIEDSKEKISKGVPLLSKIPILGSLFGFQEYDKKKTELIVLMTPHVITDHIQSKTVTEEFKERVEGIKKELEKRKK